MTTNRNIPSSESHARIDTGIPGMDVLLNGGLMANGTYLLVGGPGTGKTVIANQLCFHHAAQGRNVVYFTLLAETHDKIVSHARTLSFFKPEVIGNTFSYYSGYGALEKDGCEGLLKQLQETLRSKKAFLLVIDGINIVEESCKSGLAYKKFLNELQAFSSVINCTTVLIDVAGPATDGPVKMLADGVITLRNQVQGLLSRRFIEVVKFRGSSYFTGGTPSTWMKMAFAFFLVSNPALRQRPPKCRR